MTESQFSHHITSKTGDDGPDFIAGTHHAVALAPAEPDTQIQRHPDTQDTQKHTPSGKESHSFQIAQTTHRHTFCNRPTRKPTHTHTHAHTHTHTHANTHAHKHPDTHTNTNTHTHNHTDTDTDTPTDTETNTHTHTHASVITG